MSEKGEAVRQLGRLPSRRAGGLWWLMDGWLVWAWHGYG